jgi:hypothetical protein
MEIETAVVAEPALSDSRMGASPATVQGIAADTAASTENDLTADGADCTDAVVEAVVSTAWIGARRGEHRYHYASLALT